MEFPITAVREDELEELSRFLTAGFGTPPDAAFAAPDVLRWKYFAPRGDGRDEPRSWIVRSQGRIVGHAGVFYTTFHIPDDPPRQVPALHLVDGLARGEGAPVRTRLTPRIHETAPVQYVVGGTAVAKRPLERAGYEVVATLPVLRRVLRPGYRWRTSEGGPLHRALRVAKDVARLLQHRGRRPTAEVTLRRVESFEAETIDAVLDRLSWSAVWTSRRAGLLNHCLGYPRPTASGWLVRHGDRVLGFALLSLVAKGPVRVGKLVECLLDDSDPALWHATVAALTRALYDQGADVAETFTSAPWLIRALEDCGYFTLSHINFFLRDEMRLVPRDAPFHLTPFEADYAHL